MEPVASGENIIKIRELVWRVHVDESILNYIVDIVEESRRHPAVKLGGSPRAAIALLMAARALALMDGRDYVIPDDVKEVAEPVLNHRIILTTEAIFEGIKPTDVIKGILERVPTP